MALIFAAAHPSGKGCVYEVEPAGEVELDPDYSGPSGESVSAPRARVIREIRIPHKTLKRVRKAIMEDVF